MSNVIIISISVKNVQNKVHVIILTKHRVKVSDLYTTSKHVNITYTCNCIINYKYFDVLKNISFTFRYLNAVLLHYHFDNNANQC